MKKLTLIYLFVPCLLFSFGVAKSQSPAWNWARHEGGTSTEVSRKIILDASGNVFVCGNFSSPTYDMGDTILSNSGSMDCYIAKYDADGHLLWARTGSGASDDYGLSVVTDAQANAYLIGY